MNHLSLKKTIESIFKTNLSIKKHEQTLVFTDSHNKRTEKIAQRISTIGKKFTQSIHYIVINPTGCHGTEPPEPLWRAAFGNNCIHLLKQDNVFRQILAKKATIRQINTAEKIIKKHKNEAVRVVIALSYFSTSHTRFRDFLNRLCDTRYASMPLFDEDMLKGAMNVDWIKMSQRTSLVARAVNKCETIDITSPNGTSVFFSRKGRPVMKDTGLITKPGSFSNLPAGEVYLAPLEGTAQGRLVLAWSPTRELKQPITLTVVNGQVQKVEGKEKYVDFLRQKLAEKKENRNIAELGIGTNDRAARPDNILESEKILGTVHIALGDNSSFGGTVSTQFHQDFIFFKPTVTLNYASGYRKLLMKNGKMLIAS